MDKVKSAIDLVREHTLHPEITDQGQFQASFRYVFLSLLRDISYLVLQGPFFPPPFRI